jgi:putative sterol carrier protein
MEPMAAFLSAEWIERLAAVARDDPGLKEAVRGASFSVQQVVTGTANGTGDGTAAWYVRFENGTVEVGAGRTPDPDVVITESLEVATALSRGQTTPAEAFSTARLRLGGRVGLLVRHQRALERLAALTAAVHETTVYP